MAKTVRTKRIDYSQTHSESRSKETRLTGTTRANSYQRIKETTLKVLLFLLCMVSLLYITVNIVHAEPEFNVDVTPIDDGDKFILKITGKLDPIPEENKVYYYGDWGVKVRLPWMVGDVDIDGNFMMTETFGGGFYTEGIPLRMHIGYGDQVHVIWWPETPHEMLDGIVELREHYCNELDLCETFNTWHKDKQESYLRLMYLKDCTGCYLDVYDFTLINGKLYVYLEDTHKDDLDVLDGITWMDLNDLIGSGFAYPKILLKSQYICDTPNCNITIFELEQLQKTLSYSEMLDEIPHNMLSCPANLVEIVRKTTGIPYCVAHDSMAKLYLRGWMDDNISYKTENILVTSLAKNKIKQDVFFTDNGGMPDTLKVWIGVILESMPAQYSMQGFFDTPSGNYTVTISSHGVNVGEPTYEPGTEITVGVVINDFDE